MRIRDLLDFKGFSCFNRCLIMDFYKNNAGVYINIRDLIGVKRFSCF